METLRGSDAGQRSNHQNRHRAPGRTGAELTRLTVRIDHPAWLICPIPEKPDRGREHPRSITAVGRRYFSTESMNKLPQPSNEEVVKALLELESA